MVLLDALMAVVWLAVNFVLVRTAWRLASVVSAGESSVDRLVDALVIGLSTVIVSTIVLGMLGQLSGTSLLLLVAALVYAGELLTRRALARQSVGLVLGDALDTPQLEPRAFLQPLAGQPTTNWFGTVWGVLLAWLVSHMIVDGLLKFPTDWDCLMYHIPMVDEWLQARSLYAPDSSYWWSPGNSEVIGLWCVAPFSGDFLIALNNLPVMVLWVASTLSVARSLGMSNASSHFTALSAVLVHTSFHETDDASNDLLLVASFTAAVAYLLRDLRRPRTTDVTLAGRSKWESNFVCQRRQVDICRSPIASRVPSGTSQIQQKEGFPLIDILSYPLYPACISRLSVEYQTGHPTLLRVCRRSFHTSCDGSFGRLRRSALTTETDRVSRWTALLARLVDSGVRLRSPRALVAFVALIVRASTGI